MKRLLILFLILLSVNFQHLRSQTADSLKIESKTNLWLNGSKVCSGSTVLSNEEVTSKLREFPDIANRYKQSVRIKHTGEIITTCGVAEIVSGIVWFSSLPSTKSIDGVYTLSIMGINVGHKKGAGVIPSILLSGVGLVSSIAGVAVILNGKSKQENSIMEYNATIGRATSQRINAMQYQIGVLDNGNIGLRFIF